MKHKTRIALLSLVAFLAYSQQGAIPGRDPRFRTVGAGALASRPATCSPNRDVYICNGAGCTTNGEYHYCTATDTWTVAAGSGAATSPAGVSGNLQYNNAGAFGGAAQTTYRSAANTNQGTLEVSETTTNTNPAAIQGTLTVDTNGGSGAGGRFIGSASASGTNANGLAGVKTYVNIDAANVTGAQGIYIGSPTGSPTAGQALTYIGLYVADSAANFTWNSPYGIIQAGSTDSNQFYGGTYFDQHVYINDTTGPYGGYAKIAGNKELPLTLSTGHATYGEFGWNTNGLITPSTWHFANSGSDVCESAVVTVPADYKASTVFRFKLAWGAADDTTNAVKWTATYIVAPDGQDIDAASVNGTSSVTSTKANSNPGNFSFDVNQVTFNFDADVATIAGGDTVSVKLCRNSGDAADTLTSEAEVLSFRMIYLEQ